MPGGVVDHQRASARVPATLAMVWLALGCEPTVIIGSCAEPAEAGVAAGASAGGDAVGVPWSTGFEDGLCGYHAAHGFCYARHGADLEIVRSPTPHSGEFAAAFTVNADATTADRSQARCVREGVMPQSAYYGAWYFIPALSTNADTWNLFHFLGGTSEADPEPQPLWDVSLVNSGSNLQLSVYDFLHKTTRATSGVDPVPIGHWFRLQIKIVRSAQANGEIIVLQDGVVALHLTDVITDDTEWGQWYVGNFAKTLVPTLSTLYVDDITISEGP
jgi:hypothetical protein